MTTRTMQIKITNKMVQMLKKALPDYDFKIVKLNRREYATMVHYDIFTAMDHGDYDYANDIYKAIRVLYPANYYALPNYITSKELKELVKNNNVNNSDDLLRELKNAYEI